MNKPAPRRYCGCFGPACCSLLCSFGSGSTVCLYVYALEVVMTAKARTTAAMMRQTTNVQYIMTPAFFFLLYHIPQVGRSYFRWNRGKLSIGRFSLFHQQASWV